MECAVPSLEPLFLESVEAVRRREQNALDYLLDQRQRKVVLFGAGTLGKRALALLREMECDVVAFSDNDPSAWGTEIESVPVFSPEQSASLYRNTALFLVTIWNDHHWFSETNRKLIGFGCSLVSSYAPLFWKFPDRFLQLYLLNEPPHKVYEAARSVLEAERIWDDEESLRTYRSNIRWRALGDGSDLPGRPNDNTYFPPDLFRLDDKDHVLDCGAFDGDTIRELLDRSSTGVGTIHAVEADAISFDRLQGYVATVKSDIQSRIRLYNLAVGSRRGFVRFQASGALVSRATETGSMVELAPIDELFADTPLTFIKMDIEGAEFDALQGAAKTIRRDHPTLAICVYHTQNDIWRIPLLIKEMVPEYCFYLRAYEGDGFQTVMYAVPPERVRAHPLV